jgi:uncharacterized surface protein with fasciclin (FAS1) repeats
MTMFRRTFLRTAIAVALALGVTACGGGGPKPPTIDPSSLLGILGGRPELATLSGQSPMTILAPSNAAFDALGPVALENLRKPENRGQLADVLKNHLVSGSLRSADISAKGAAGVPTLWGKSLPVGREGEALTIGGAQVTTGDIYASNGVVHVIDRVLMP